MENKETDYMHFVSPYTTANRVKRILWNVCWTLLTRPFPKSTMMPWKRLLLRMFGAKIAPNAMVYSTVKIFMPWNFEIQEGACVASGVDIYNAAKVTIGKKAVISQRAYICTASHNIYSKNHEQIQKPITISDMSWVAAEAFVGPGVVIGEGAVLGARGCAFKNIEPWTIAGGNPAKILHKREFKN